MILSVIALLWFAFCLPSPLFNDSYSVTLRDRDGGLLSAKIAGDGQWRFPENKSINPKFAICILAFEDQYFFNHPGINMGSVFRAIKQNSRAGKIVSGGSTITMQLARLIRKNKGRTYFEKLVEMVMALRLECGYSKKELLSLYCAHAPFGTNVVGVDAASWRYFGRDIKDLSWAECATLAVLPNAPSMIYPGKNQERLRQKRNRLLYKLHTLNVITEETYLLAKQEPLPQKPFPLPAKASHLLNRLITENPGVSNFESTIDPEIQERSLDILKKHAAVFKHNEIHNLCALIIDIKKNQVVSYIGNTPLRDKELHGEDVDIITSQRSTGSLLKPYLYACMLQDGELLPNMLVPDVPTQIAGYVPQNFNFTYDGAVPAKQALARSLNIPAVKLLQQYTVEKFLDRLKQLGLKSMNRSAGNYGLSLILGGGESKLWEMCSSYASMAKVLNRYNVNKTYSQQDWNVPDYLLHKKIKTKSTDNDKLFSAGTVWFTLEAMAEVNRPDIDASWQRFANAKKVAWKTGTSFGFRDAWAIGISGNYVIGVWVGNADGEGRPGLTGISAAAPLLFELFGTLPAGSWYQTPASDLKAVQVCRQSGCLPGPYCQDLKKELIPRSASPAITCRYHRMVQLDAGGTFQVSDVCESPLNMQSVPWFVLPPVQEYYFKTKHPAYKTLPPFKPGCEVQNGKSMEMIYPKPGTIIYVPYELNGEQGRTVFEVAHRNMHSVIYWHLDGALVGTTSDIHQLGLSPAKGKHMLSLTDEQGETLTIPFEVVSEKRQ